MCVYRLRHKRSLEDKPNQTKPNRQRKKGEKEIERASEEKNESLLLFGKSISLSTRSITHIYTLSLEFHIDFELYRFEMEMFKLGWLSVTLIIFTKNYGSFQLEFSGLPMDFTINQTSSSKI